MSEKPVMLDGIRVVDLTTVVFGPYATQILADLGADVIKVESPGAGDAFRWSGKAAVTPGMAPAWMALNRGKKSVALDLKAEADREVILGLLRDADVFVVNVRGKALERIGLDYESLKAINPGLIYVHCVGFGQDGPYADLQAYDDVIQAATGTTTLLPRVDGNPAPRYLPSLIADKVAGLHAAYATLAAVVHKQRTGEGQHVEVPMFEVFSSFMLLEHLSGLSFDPPNA
ncbi:MAG: carnitine dehydratase, partial [Sphingomonadales bacterium 39-62-4]